jgi:uncharacterized membrane protein YGL010W
MNDHHQTLSGKVVYVLNWIAAALGIGTLADAVNVAVGVVSAIWLSVQIVGYFVYDRPYKRARLAAARAGLFGAHDDEKEEQ